jgi:hypothetical protein
MTKKNEDSFQLPIFYLEDKIKLDDNIIKDIELLETPDKKSLYDYALNPETKFSNMVVPLWSEYYTANKGFLKDSQKLLKKFKNTISFESDAEKAHTHWANFKGETNFKGKYQYLITLVFSHFAYCFFNNSFFYFKISRRSCVL